MQVWKRNAQNWEEFLSTLFDFQSTWDGHRRFINAAKNRIKLLVIHTKPVHLTFYREGSKTRKLEKAEIIKMLEQQIIEPEQTEWTAPIVVAHKKMEKNRFCVDHRKHNAITKRYSYPNQRIDECTDSLGKAVIFSTLDANSGYLQI